jgi:hypothetical protein
MILRKMMLLACVSFGVFIADGASASSLRWYIADLKTSFPQHRQYSSRTALTDANYVAVLNGLKNGAKVDGIRVPIFPNETSPSHYSKTYKSIIAYARSINLAVYASPMSVGMNDYSGWSNTKYAGWLATYVNFFHPEFLSPFNEPGIDDGRIIDIMTQLRPMLASSTRILGPDRQHVGSTLDDLARNPSVAEVFDIIDAHSANRDSSATAANWSALVRSESKPVWSSENPANWSAGVDSSLPGISEAVNSGVEGLVVWYAKPSLVDDSGRPTEKALEIIERLGK